MSDRGGESDAPGPTGTATASDPTIIDVTPTPEAEPERHRDTRQHGRFGAATMGALVGLIVALASSPYWAPSIASILPWAGTPDTTTIAAEASALQAKLDTLETRLADLAQAQQRVAALEPRVAQLEQRPAAAANSRDAQQTAQQAQALSTLSDRLASLEQRITTLAATNGSQTAADATKALQAEVQTLSQKVGEQSQLLAKLQSQEASGADRDRTDAALLVAVGQLRAALATSRPYAAELQASEALASRRPDMLQLLQTLDERAERGIPNLATLTERFGAVAAEVDRAIPPPTEGGWREQLFGRVKRLFHIRRVADGSTGDSNDAEGALAASEAALKLGDLAGAVTTLRRLEGPAAEGAKQWLSDAQVRLDVDRTLASVNTALTRDILAAPAGAKP